MPIEPSSHCLAFKYALVALPPSPRYFPAESTQEMLDEWRPLFCPFDMSMLEGVNLLGEFLPTTMRTGDHARGFQLWFHEFMGLWLGNRSKVQWDEVSQPFEGLHSDSGCFLVDLCTSL